VVVLGAPKFTDGWDDSVFSIYGLELPNCEEGAPLLEVSGEEVGRVVFLSSTGAVFFA
jgi:hypothetical protein